MIRQITCALIISSTFFSILPAKVLGESHRDIIFSLRCIEHHIQNIVKLTRSRIPDYCEKCENINLAKLVHKNSILANAFQHDLARWCAKQMDQFTSYNPIIGIWKLYRSTGVGSNLQEEVIFLKEFSIIILATYQDFLDSLHSKRFPPKEKILQLYSLSMENSLEGLSSILDTTWNKLESALLAHNLRTDDFLWKRGLKLLYKYPIVTCITLYSTYRAWMLYKNTP